jgi:hypothetical protein
MKRKGLGIAAAAALAAWAGGLFLARTWHNRWGATEEETKKKLPGDELTKKWRSTRAINIHAPKEEVWRWLVQIGQDKAGFYSYTMLENLFLAGMRNSDQIVPEWQELKAGDYVRLASKHVYGDIPLLRVEAIEPDHYLVLEGWGAFVLEPIDEKTTRLLIRTHGDKLLADPVSDFLFWEPAHFIMERGMMRGIRKRAERNYEKLAS